MSQKCQFNDTFGQHVAAEDHAAVIDWLRTRTDLDATRVSELIDAWYTDFVTEEALTPVVG